MVKKSEVKTYTQTNCCRTKFAVQHAVQQFLYDNNLSYKLHTTNPQQLEVMEFALNRIL